MAITSKGIAANEFGETFVLNNVVDDQRAESLVRSLCQVSKNDIAAIDHALEMQELRDALIPGTISKSLRLGRIWRESLTDIGTAPKLIADNGRLAFTGVVSRVHYETRDGFTVGTIELEGSNGL